MRPISASSERFTVHRGADDAGPLQGLPVEPPLDPVELIAQAERRPGRRIRAVFSLLSDKALDQVLRPLLPLIDGWSVAGLEGPRGRPAADLVSAISAGSKASVQSYASVQSAFSATLAQSAADDLVIAFGSFAVAEAVLRLPPTASD